MDKYFEKWYDDGAALLSADDIKKACYLSWLSGCEHGVDLAKEKLKD